MTKRKTAKRLRVKPKDDFGTQMVHYMTQIKEAIAPYQSEWFGGILGLFVLLTLFNLLGLASGTLTNSIGDSVRILFGWGTAPIVLSIGVLSFYLLRGLWEENPAPISLETIVGLELALLGGLAVLHTFSGGADPLALAQENGGGGLVGWSLSLSLQALLGQWLTGFFYLIVCLSGLGLVFRLKMNEVSDWANTLAQRQAVPQTESTTPDAPAVTPPAAKKKKAPTKRAKKKAASPPKPSMSADEAIQAATRTPRGKYSLPPLDLLAPISNQSAQAVNASYQAQTIEETLRGFGVPAEVVEVNAGPTVTQFGVKPGTITKKLADGQVVEQRIRVSKISSLVNDLALALAAAPIRIETPVPGRPIVGIEVPNGTATTVSLRDAMESEAFAQKSGKLIVGLGDGVGGDTTVIDLTQMPHLLIAGATGSGKSICINSIIVNLLMMHTPDKLKFLMIDPKMVELITYNGIPHLIAPVVTDFEQVAGALAWVTREMERRYKAFAAVGARSVGGYNRKVKKDEQLPFLVVIIDELADLMMLAADEVERYIARIAQMARATGIHMIIATQRPSTDVVTGLIKANFPSRIAFAVASQIDSRVILDTPGAEKLLGKGDMLYMAPDSPQLARLQGCWVSDEEISNIVQFWKRTGSGVVVDSKTKVDGEHRSDDANPGDTANAVTKLPWDDLVKEASQDDLLQEAVKIVIETGRASTSFLQRRLGIGYPRASRLIDQLEEEGVIGPAEGSNPRTVLWQENSEDVEA
ncbi:MAG: DNA translocase FtsK [Chloroflexota bacterium]